MEQAHRIDVNVLSNGPYDLRFPAAAGLSEDRLSQYPNVPRPKPVSLYKFTKWCHCELEHIERACVANNHEFSTAHHILDLNPLI